MCYKKLCCQCPTPADGQGRDRRGERRQAACKIGARPPARFGLPTGDLEDVGEAPLDIAPPRGQTMTHSYPFSRMIGDYLRASSGLLLTAGPALSLRPLPAVSLVVLSALAVLFAGFALQTRRRQRATLQTDGNGIAQAPRGLRLRWDALTDVRLAYYSTRRDAEGGWLRLTLWAGRQRIVVDSRLEGFPHVLRRAAGAAVRNDLHLEPATRYNLTALGLPVRHEG